MKYCGEAEPHSHYHHLHLQCVYRSHKRHPKWKLCVTQRQAVDLCLPWSSLFSMPNGLSLPHTIPHISSYSAPVEPPWPPLQWHINATLLSQQPTTPLIHQALWVSSRPSLSQLQRHRKFTIKNHKKKVDSKWEEEWSGCCGVVWDGVCLCGREGSFSKWESGKNESERVRGEARGFTMYWNCFHSCWYRCLWKSLNLAFNDVFTFQPLWH